MTTNQYTRYSDDEYFNSFEWVWCCLIQNSELLKDVSAEFECKRLWGEPTSALVSIVDGDYAEVWFTDQLPSFGAGHIYYKAKKKSRVK